MDWSLEEIEPAVADYLHMLTQELAGQCYNKTAHRWAPSEELNGRSDGAIERKHQNINATLGENGVPLDSGLQAARQLSAAAVRHLRGP